MKTSRLKIVNSKGISLNARLELPADQRARHFAIFAHCFTCSSTLSAVKHVSRALTTSGFGVLRFDFTGLGKSEGDFADSHFTANVQDLLDVHAYMAEHYKAPGLLVGHSLGGAAVLVAASKLDEVKAVATVGAPAHVDHVKHLFEKDLNEGGIEGRAKVSIGGRPFEIDEHFVEELSKTNLLEVVKSLRKPLLILHSPTDRTVGVENAEQIYRAAHHPKSFVTLDKADHLLSDGKDSRYVGQMVGAWVQRYFDQEPEEELRTEGHQLVGHLNLIEDNFTTSIQMPNHALIADEPEHIGGDDLGPAPYDLMLSGLAACTVMTLKMYAARKEWDLQEAYVYLDYSKKHSDELEIEVEKPGQVDFIAKELRLIGDLTAEQKERLKQISAKCPVHRTLTSQVVFETSIID